MFVKLGGRQSEQRGVRRWTLNKPVTEVSAHRKWVENLKKDKEKKKKIGRKERRRRAAASV